MILKFASFGYARTEYHFKNCGGHHGRIFEDVPNQPELDTVIMDSVWYLNQKFN